MCIQIKINNKNILYDIDENETVLDLKKRISNDYKINDLNSFYLMYESKYLYSNSKISECNILKNKYIDVIHKLGYGGYLFININNKIERINVSLDHNENRIITKVCHIKNYIKELFKNNDFVLTINGKILDDKFDDSSLNELGIINVDKPIFNNMIYVK